MKILHPGVALHRVVDVPVEDGVFEDNLEECFKVLLEVLLVL